MANNTYKEAHRIKQQFMFKKRAIRLMNIPVKIHCYENLLVEFEEKHVLENATVFFV